MPKITHMKTTKDTIEGNTYGDQAIPVEDYQRFVSTLDTAYVGPRRFNEEYIEWSPQFPIAESPHYATLADEALYRSNYRVVVESFDSAGIDYIACGGSGTFHFNPGDTHALALACWWEQEMDGYPIADEQDYTDLEMELVEEAFDSYGRDDVITWLQENENYLELLDEEGEVLPGLEHHIFTLFMDCHSDNGEGYVSDAAMEYATASVASEMRYEFEQVQPPLTQGDAQ